jgi:hypothetical protein
MKEDSMTVMTAITVPEATEGVTTEWLNSVISLKYPDVRIESSRIEEVIWGNSGKVRVSLDYNQAGRDLGLPARVIVKGGYNRYGPEFQYVYGNEMRFYRDIAPLLDTTVPLCLFSGHDEANNQSIVILEDLSLRDITWCHATRPMAYEEAASFLRSMAAYNAKWWQSPELLPGGKFGWMWETLDGPVGKYLETFTQPDLWNKYLVMERGQAVPRVLHDRERIVRAYAELKKIYKTAPFCMVHGDEHQGNIYIEPDGRAGFLDWQVKRGPWSQGVTYFMVGGLDVVDRRNWERALLGVYLDALRDNGVAPPSFETAWLAYRREALYGFLVWVINDVDFQIETVNVACATRFAHAMIDHDTLGLLL